MKNNLIYSFIHSILHFIVSKGGANSADLNPLGFYFEKLKLHEGKRTT